MKADSTMTPEQEEAWIRGLLAKRPPPPRHVQQAMTLKAERKLYQAVRGPACLEGMAHHWRIGEAAGRTSAGCCKHCGLVKPFKNSADETGPGERYGYRERHETREAL